MTTGAEPGVVDFPTLGILLADWIEQHCVVPDGFAAGDPFVLSDWQLWDVVQHYRVKPTAVRGQLATAFVYRRSQIVRPQKTGKGPFIAAMVCAEGVGPVVFAGWATGGEVYRCRDHGCLCGWEYAFERGEPMGLPWPTPLIQITATSEEQTDNIYGALRPMIDNGWLSEQIPKTGEEFTRLPGGGRIDTVTSNARSRLGQRVTFVPQDETGIWTPTSGMIKVAETQRRGLAGMGGRAIETTNPWDPAENSVAQRTHESRALDIFKDFPQAPAQLSYRNKQERRRIHRLVYAGSPWVDLDAIEAEAAELLETDPGQAERFFGNRIVAGLNTWLPDGLWTSRRAAEPQLPADGTSICVGFDGSLSDDWTAIRAETFTGYQFTPTYGDDLRPAVWNPAEWGGQIPRTEVRAAIDEIFTRYRVGRGYFDPEDWWSEIDDWALAYGEKVVVAWSTNRPVPMHEALKRFVSDLPERIEHDGDPHAETQMRNARKLARPGQRYILGKPSNHQKIDVAMASVLAHEAAADARVAGWDPQPPSRRVVIYR